jgi:hypothetical protein
MRLGMNSKRWWKKKSKDIWKSVFETLGALDSSTQERLNSYAKYLGLYMNKPVGGFGPGGSSVGSLADEYKKHHAAGMPLSFNAIENCISALGARIASQRPRARFLTSTEGANAWELQQRAKGMEKFVAGVWSSEKIYRMAPGIFFDGACLGFGACKVFGADGKICFERVFPGFLVVDEVACRFSEPRELFQYSWVPAEVLAAQFPKKESVIMSVAGRQASFYEEGKAIVTDLVKVVEAWHLPSSSEAGDGRHAICIDSSTLHEEEYTSDRFPFAFFRWQQPRVGWYPQGLIEQQEPTQLFVNKMAQRIQQAMHLYAVTRTFYVEGSIDPAKIRNKTGDLVPVAQGMQLPVTQSPPSMASDMIQMTWDAYGKIFEGTGVSQLSAAGVKPAGIEAAVALRALEEKEAGRHSLTALAYEDFFIDLAELTVQVAKDMGTVRAKYRTSDGLELVDWKNVDMDRDMFELQVFPTSMLPYTPAGRLAAVEEMLNAGFIDRKQALSLLDAPDLEQFSSLETASLEDIDKQIHQMLVKGEKVEPETYQDMELALSRATSALIRSRTRGAPEKNQKLLLDYIDKCALILTPPEPPVTQPPPAGAMPGAPIPPAGEMPMPIPEPQAPIPMATPEQQLK